MAFRGGIGRGRGMSTVDLEDSELLAALAENSELKKDIKVLQRTIQDQDVACEEWGVIYQKRFDAVEEREKCVADREKSVEAKSQENLSQVIAVRESMEHAEEMASVAKAAGEKAQHMLDILNNGMNLMGATDQPPCSETLRKMVEAMTAIRLSTRNLQQGESAQAARILAQQAEQDYEWSEIRKKEEELLLWTERLSKQEKDLEDGKKALTEKEEIFSKQEKAVQNERKKAFADKEEDLSKREKQLVNEKKSLADKEGRLTKQEKELKNEKLALADKEGKLSKQEKELMNETKVLADKEKDLSKQVKELINENVALVDKAEKLENQEKQLEKEKKDLADREESNFNQAILLQENVEHAEAIASVAKTAGLKARQILNMLKTGLNALGVEGQPPSSETLHTMIEAMMTVDLSTENLPQGESRQAEQMRKIRPVQAQSTAKPLVASSSKQIKPVPVKSEKDKLTPTQQKQNKATPTPVTKINKPVPFKPRSPNPSGVDRPPWAERGIAVKYMEEEWEEWQQQQQNAEEEEDH